MRSLLESLDLGLDGGGPLRVLLLGLVQRSLRLVDRLLTAFTVLLPGGLFPRPFTFAARLFPFVGESGLPFRRLVDGARGSFLLLLAFRLAGRLRRFSAAKIGGQLGMFAERSVGSNRAPENDAGLCHGRGDDVRIVALLRRALVEEIAVGAPRLQSRLHRWSGDRLIEEAQRGLIGLQFSGHRIDPPSRSIVNVAPAAAPCGTDAALKRSLIPEGRPCISQRALKDWPRMSRTSTLPKRLQPMLATLTDAPFDDPGWVFEDKYDGFRMIAEIRRGKVALYSRNGKIISHSYIEVAKALEGVKGDAVIDGELVAIGKDGVSHFQLLQNALRHEAKLLYCAFDLMFENAVDLRKQPLLERKKRLKAILPRDKLIAFSPHRKENGTKFFAEAERKGLEGLMAKRADSAYASGGRTADWLKIKTAKRQEVVIAGFTAPRRTRPFFGALVLAVREDDAWRYIGHVGTGFSHKVLEDLHAKLVKLTTPKSPFPAKVKDEAATTWVKPSLVAEVKFAEWTSKGELRQPVYLGLRSDKRAKDVVRERERPRK